MKNQDRHVRCVANPPAERPVMVFDGDCDFCRFWIARWREATRESVDYQPFQEAAAHYPEIPREAFEQAVQFIEPDGRVSGGAEAVFRALDFSGKKNRLCNLLGSFPGFGRAAQVAYRFVANHRGFFSFLTRLFWGRSLRRPTYFVARWVFLRLLGVIYFIAFVSLLVQIRGLAGKRGILPAGEYLQAAGAQLGGNRFWQVPTLCWLNASDHFLMFLCLAGAAISCVLACGFFPGVCLLFLWALYLSLATVCGDFLNFQWDALLLQTGFLAIFLTPLALRPDWENEGGGARMARRLLLWLLFCLMFESGVVKLMNDEAWRNWTALTYHYETQPLPIWTSWYFNQEPLWFEKMSVALMFAAELVAPFAVFGPRNARRAGCAALITLQLLIAATGNYCFFNLLAIALCLLLLDDEAWPRWWREKILRENRAGQGMPWPLWIVGSVAGVDLLLSAVQIAGSFRVRIGWPAPVIAIYEVVAPFRTFNNYGLFAVMTKSRPEIIVEGSDDGEHWRAYEFKWKPGDVYRLPGLVAPYQPRLDWQMWFAALGSYRENPWFLGFLERLLQGSPEVQRLLATNPFPNAPPRYVRAVLYDYKFTRQGENTQAWWKREYQGLYCPPVSLSQSNP